MFIMLSTNLLSGVIREWSDVFMHRSGRDFKGFMDETGLSFSQISVLMRLKHGGNSGISEIGDRLGVTIAAASKAVDRLVQLGYIGRSEDPEDRRAKCLTLTEKGHALIEKGVEVRSKWIEGLTDALTSDQQNMIISALTLLTDAARNTQE
jgi:DNA-binding MarR family transcriptional regulator